MNILLTNLKESTNKKASEKEALNFQSGNVLLSRAVARQVPSALLSLTSVFGMGTGGSSMPSSPDVDCRLHRQALSHASFAAIRLPRLRPRLSVIEIFFSLFSLYPEN